MKLSEFDYDLSERLIAHKPHKPRDACKLMVCKRDKKSIIDDFFYNIDKYLQPGDVLVLNNTKVIPARLYGSKAGTGGRVEVFFLNHHNDSEWNVLVKGSLKKGQKIIFDKTDLEVTLKEHQKSIWLVDTNKSKKDILRILDLYGQAPLPPYIKKSDKESLVRKQYQTVYSESPGSVAAPTAGLHFTTRLLEKLRKKGIVIEYVTLHVGLGTFSPVRVENIKQHKMHAEYVNVKKETIKNLISAKKNKKRVIAVGTTSVRVLEGVVSQYLNKKISEIQNYNGWVNIFIYPGYEYSMVDGLITNFHLPKSTLLMLVAAFIGANEWKFAYKHAILNKYRFYSFGDAMFVY